MAERRAHTALTRAGFADPDIAAGVLRQVQVLTLTPRLARLSYDTAEDARAAVASLIIPGLPAAPADAMPAGQGTPAVSEDRGAAQFSRPHAAAINDHTAAGAGQRGPALPAPALGASTAPQASREGDEEERTASEEGNRDARLIAAAAGILAEATRHGDRLSQAALAGKLRGQGHGIANERLRWLLAQASNLAADRHPGSPLPEPGTPDAAAEPAGRLPATVADLGSRINGNARNQAASPRQWQPGQHGIQLPGER